MPSSFPAGPLPGSSANHQKNDYLQRQDQTVLLFCSIKEDTGRTFILLKTSLRLQVQLFHRPMVMYRYNVSTMTTEVNCHIYYSISGDAFSLPDLETDVIAHTPTILNIYTREEVEVPNVTAVQQLAEVITELSVPYPIKKGQFFNSESRCLFLNSQGQVLKVNGQYLFAISMMRDGNDHERLHIKFSQPYFLGRHLWEDVAGQAHPKAPPVAL